MTILRSAVDLETAYPSSPDASLWLDDLRWHKKMYRQSRFRWWGQHVVDIVTWETGGQTEFITVAHLQELQRHQYKVLDQACVVRNAMAKRLQLASDTFGDEWVTVSDALAVSQTECASAVWFAGYAAPDEFSNSNVQRVLKFVPFRNPLIEAWELKQLLRLFEAAANMLEDAICDLAEELTPTRPAGVIAEAAGTPVSGLQHRINQARSERGASGDERRVPEQVF